jgi:hypothetical protein
MEAVMHMKVLELARDRNVRQTVLKKPLLWLAIGGGLASFLFLTRKKAEAAPLPSPPQTFGEPTRVALAVPTSWRRATSAEVAALPELRGAASALVSAPGFTSMPYGKLLPFVASDGRTYATWVEQHFHEPGGPVLPWGLHHGVTLLTRVGGTLLDER